MRIFITKVNRRRQRRPVTTLSWPNICTEFITDRQTYIQTHLLQDEFRTSVLVFFVKLTSTMTNTWYNFHRESWFTRPTCLEQSDQKWRFFSRNFGLLFRQFSKVLGDFPPNCKSLDYFSVKIQLLALCKNFLATFRRAIWQLWFRVGSSESAVFSNELHVYETLQSGLNNVLWINASVCKSC